MEVELTERERAVLGGIKDGRTYAEIARDLGVGFETVKTYASRLRAKTGQRSKVKLALWAVRHERKR